MQLCLANFPRLNPIAWNRRNDDFVKENEALALYGRNWRYADMETGTRKSDN